MTPEDKTRLAAVVLQRGKAIARDRFPKPSLEVAEMWGRILGTLNFPLEIWPEAVDMWAAENVGDRMATPRDIVQAAKSVRDRWESDPVRREYLRAHRERLRDARDAALEAGTLEQVRVYPELSSVTWPGGDGLPGLGAGGD